MQKNGFLRCLCFSLTMVAFGNCQKSDSHRHFFSDEKVSALDSFIVAVQNTFPIPGIAVAIIKDDEVFYKTAGYRDQSRGLISTDSTPFFMGNISELMTATGVVKLAQSGKINLEDPVIKYLPYFKLASNTYSEITIKHLLTHSSGVPVHNALWDIPSYDSKALESITRSIALQPPVFNSPGSRIKRSQFNYDILADLIEKASGKRFEDYMNEEVIQSLEMTNAAYYNAEISSVTVARPHVIDNWLTYSLTNQKSYPHNREHAGSIGFHASVKDITKWMSMLFHDGKFGNKSFIDEDLNGELFKGHFKTGEDSYVGFGWEIKKQKQSLFYTKTHYIGGFSADITMVPDQKMGVLVMTNVSDGFDPSAITDQIIQWMMGSKLNTPKIPIHMVMGQMLDSNNCLDSALNLYTNLKQQYPDRYDYSHASLSLLGVNLMHRLNRKEDAITVFNFILEQFPSSPYAHLDLAEAYVVNNNILKAEQQLAIIKAMSLKLEPTVSSHMAYLEEAINISKEEKPETHSQEYLSN